MFTIIITEKHYCEIIHYSLFLDHYKLYHSNFTSFKQMQIALMLQCENTVNRPFEVYRQSNGWLWIVSKQAGLGQTSSP